jgi:hypothetical protein
MKRESNQEIKQEKKKVKLDQPPPPSPESYLPPPPDFSRFVGKTIVSVAEDEDGNDGDDQSWFFKFEFDDKTSLSLNVIDNWGVEIK